MRPSWGCRWMFNPRDTLESGEVLKRDYPPDYLFGWGRRDYEIIRSAQSMSGERGSKREPRGAEPAPRGTPSPKPSIDRDRGSENLLADSIENLPRTIIEHTRGDLRSIAAQDIVGDKLLEEEVPRISGHLLSGSYFCRCSPCAGLYSALPRPRYRRARPRRPSYSSPRSPP